MRMCSFLFKLLFIFVASLSKPSSTVQPY